MRRRRRFTSARRWPTDCARPASLSSPRATRGPAARAGFFTVRAGSLVAWRADGTRSHRFESSAATPTARICVSNSTPTASYRAGRWSRCSRTAARGLTRGSTATSASAAGCRSGPATTIDHRLIRIDEPILRVPQLAIHLAEDRKAVSLDPQRHINAVWGVGSGARSFLGYVAERAGVDAADVLGADLMTHDLTPSTLAGAGRRAAQRTAAGQSGHLLRRARGVPGGRAARNVPVLALFDHEEVGSQSDHGAQSELLLTVLERITLAAGVAARSSCAGCRVRWWRPATWRTPRTRTIRPPRTRPPDRGQRGPVLKVQPNLRTPPTVGPRGVRAGVRRPSPAAALRTSGRSAVRIHDRTDDLGAHRHPDRRRRCRPVGHALGARGDGRRRRRGLRRGPWRVPVAG